MTEELSLTLPRRDTVDTAIDIAPLVETYAPLLFRVAHSVLRNRAEAEDAVQDTFVRVLEHKRNLPAVRDRRAWLIRITWNLALDRRRRIRPDQMDTLFAQSLVDKDLPADAALLHSQQTAAVLREIDRLPRHERQVLLLSALEEIDHTEIALIMNKSDSAIRALLFRARTRLRTRLEQGGHA